MNVTMTNARASGTIVSSFGRRGRGGGTQFSASSYWGLVKRGENDYEIVQIYYKATTTQNLYLRAFLNGAQVNTGVGAGSACTTKDTYARLPDAQYDDIIWTGLKNSYGQPIPRGSSMYCRNKLLYQYAEVPLRTPSLNTTTRYYRRDPGVFLVYTTYSPKIQSAAVQWKNEYGKGGSGSSSGATSADISSIPNIFYPDLSVFLEADAILNADPDYKRALSLAPNRLPNGMPNFVALRTTIRTALERKGWPTSQINAFLVSKGVKIDSTSTRLPGGGSGGGQSNRLNNPPKPAVAPTPAVTKVVVRAPYGFAKPATKAPDNRPQIVQNYKTYVKDNSADNGIKESQGQDIFVFPYTPNNISYSGLGSKWNNIDRAGNFPIVEWSSWDLMRCEMEFLVAEDRIDGSTRVPDGMFVSVQNRLNTLRRMSQRQAAVTVFNLDDLFRVQVKRAQQTGKALQFVIADLSITSTRRSIDSVEKEITAASVKLTLQEIPIEKVTLVKMSPPIMSKPVTPSKPGSNDDGDSDPLFTDGWRPVGSG